jgi:anti-sigma factor RsiW
LEHPLRPEQAKRLADHLSRCARCRAVHSALHQADDLFGEHRWSEPEPDLTARVLARLPHGRRAVIPSTPAWTRASTIVVAALAVVLLGVSALVLLAGTALGYGGWPLVQESGRSLIAAGWEGLSDFVSALGTAAAGLWQVLRWPWVPIAATIIVVCGGVWGWLWVRSGRWRS